LVLVGLVSFVAQAGAEKGALRVYLDPLPSSIVRVTEEQPLTVPAGRILVVKSLGDATGSSLSTIRLLVDGVPTAAVQLGGPSPATLGFPVTARAGQVVSVEESFPDPNTLAFAAGYLAAP
jgi:hypothetical protein